MEGNDKKMEGNERKLNKRKEMKGNGRNERT
jgi:hypothetical protein